MANVGQMVKIVESPPASEYVKHPGDVREVVAPRGIDGVMVETMEDFGKTEQIGPLDGAVRRDDDGDVG